MSVAVADSVSLMGVPGVTVAAAAHAVACAVPIVHTLAVHTSSCRHSSGASMAGSHAWVMFFGVMGVTWRVADVRLIESMSTTSAVAASPLSVESESPIANALNDT